MMEVYKFSFHKLCNFYTCSSCSLTYFVSYGAHHEMRITHSLCSVTNIACAINNRVYNSVLINETDDAHARGRIESEKAF